LRAGRSADARVAAPDQAREALASLRAGREHLDKATPDKGGHRASAIVHVKEAIKETEAGIEFDNRH
jgi:hypothetical protein